MANWYLFKGGVPTAPASYTLVGSEPTCDGTTTICAIMANAGGTTIPSLTPALKDEIIIALNSGTNSANVLLHD